MKTIYFFLAATLVFASCNTSSDVNEDEGNKDEQSTGVNIISPEEIMFSEEQIKMAGIETGKIRHKPLSETIECIGFVQANPDNIVSVTPVIGGVVKSLLVLPGKEVRKGETIATLQHQNFIEIQKEFLKTKNQLDFLEKEYNRQKTLMQENASASKIFEKTESDYKTQQSIYTALYEQLKMMELNPEIINEDNIITQLPIKAPISGFINKVNINVGKYISEKEVLLEIINNENIHLELEVFEKDALNIKKGQAIDFSIENSNSKFSAEVILVGQSIDPETRTIGIHGHFSEKFDQLKHGMRVNAKIHVKSDTLDVLPENAIISNNDKHYIFILTEEGSFKKMSIDINFTDNGCTSVITNYSLPENNNLIVVIEGANYIEAELNKATE